MTISLAVALLAVVGIAGLALCFGGVRRIARRKPVSGSTESLCGGALIAVAGLGLGIAGNLYTYQRFTDELPVAELYFQRLGEAHFVAQISGPSGEAWFRELYGDEWQLDARVLRWQGVATLVGFDPLYRLERISGRYRDVSQEQTAERTVYALSDNAGLDLWRLAKRHQRWLPWVDATYGSATYLPMADEARYAVNLSASGLIARPTNAAGRDAVQNW